MSTGTPTATATHTYDDADRLIDTGLVYDSFGRTLSLPGVDTTNPSAGAVTLGYYRNDLVRSQSQGTSTQCWSLDPSQRLRQSLSYTASTGACTGTISADVTNHYDAASGDSPDWIAENNDASTWTANVSDLLGSLAATVNQTAAVTTATYQYANLHGDVQATSTADVLTIRGAFDEFGNPSDTTPRRYGWLGAKQRSGDAIGGVLLMGVRLYVPLLGRFLSVDPVKGGSSHDYDYAGQDPINTFDLDGRCFRHCDWTGGFKKVWKHRAIAQFAVGLACPVCGVAWAAAEMAYAIHTGDGTKILGAAIGFVPAGGGFAALKYAKYAKRVGKLRSARNWRTRGLLWSGAGVVTDWSLLQIQYPSYRRVPSGSASRGASAPRAV